MLPANYNQNHLQLERCSSQSLLSSFNFIHNPCCHLSTISGRRVLDHLLRNRLGKLLILDRFSPWRSSHQLQGNKGGCKDISQIIKFLTLAPHCPPPPIIPRHSTGASSINEQATMEKLPWRNKLQIQTTSLGNTKKRKATFVSSVSKYD